MNTVLDTSDVPDEFEEKVRNDLTESVEKFVGRPITQSLRYELTAALTDYCMAHIPPLEAECDFVQSDQNSFMFRITITRPYEDRQKS